MNLKWTMWRVCHANNYKILLCGLLCNVWCWSDTSTLFCILYSVFTVDDAVNILLYLSGWSCDMFGKKMWNAIYAIFSGGSCDMRAVQGKGENPTIVRRWVASYHIISGEPPHIISYHITSHIWWATSYHHSRSDWLSLIVSWRGLGI